MKMKILSLILILVLSMSMVSSASAYGHGDIRAGELGYLSCSQMIQQLWFSNNPGVSTSNTPKWNHIEETDTWARKFMDVSEKSTKEKYYWNPFFNSDHVFKFWLEVDLYSCTPSMTINEIDYNKGLFVAANTDWGKQWANVYYYDTDGIARTATLNYNPY
jgi:hypothetical protein